MIKVTIELLPFGDERRSRVIADATISLQAKGATKSIGDYTYRFSKQSHKERSAWTMFANGMISGFPRGRQNCWRLLYACLKDALEE